MGEFVTDAIKSKTLFVLSRVWTGTLERIYRH